MKKIVYLAGRVGGEKWNVAKKFANVEWIASDGSNHSEHDWGYAHYNFNDDTLRDSVRSEALSAIDRCHMLIAYLYDNQSYGSIAEIAYASTIGRPCHVVIRHNPKHLNDNNLFNAYWFVCHFPGVTVYEIFCDCMAEKAFQEILNAPRN